MPARILPAVFLSFAVGSAGCATGSRIVQDLGPGPRMPAPTGFSLACSYLPEGDGQPPLAVRGLCEAGAAADVRVTRVPGGLRARVRFADQRGRQLEIYVYRGAGQRTEEDDGFDRGARIVTRMRDGNPVVDVPAAGWIAVQGYDRAKKELATRFALRFPGVVVNGAIHAGGPKRQQSSTWTTIDSPPANTR